MTEFELINNYFKWPLTHAGVIAGIGDDAALVCPPKEALVVCCDTLVEGVHFPRGTTPYDSAYKALAVNLSDLAAMGAKPLYFLLSITLPSNDPVFCKSFAEGLRALAEPLNLPLVGGDTSRGPLSITITAMGEVDPTQALLRNKAQVGDNIYVVDTIGGAAFGLAVVLDRHQPASVEDELAVTVLLNRPQPKVGLGQALVGIAHSAIDVSDGLLQDLGHILQASHKGAQLDLASLPIHRALDHLSSQERFRLACSGGDDYTLVITAPPQRERELQTLAASLGHQLTRIGTILAEPGYVFENVPEGVSLTTQGYIHF